MRRRRRSAHGARSNAGGTPRPAPRKSCESTSAWGRRQITLKNIKQTLCGRLDTTALESRESTATCDAISVGFRGGARPVRVGQSRDTALPPLAQLCPTFDANAFFTCADVAP